MGFREALVDAFEKEKEQAKNWKVMAKRITANFLVVILLVLSAYAVIKVVERSEQEGADDSWIKQNEITIVMSLISFIVPNMFDVISLLENYHPRYRCIILTLSLVCINDVTTLDCENR